MNGSVTQAPVICIHEDRSTHLVGAKLAVLSLLKHCPRLPIVISCPAPPAAFCDWVGRLGARVSLVSYPELKNLGWNVKPAVLLRLLEAGYSEIIWVDSDIIANGDGLSPLLSHGADTVVATQEAYWQEMYWGHPQDGKLRTLAWGLTPKRPIPFVINTGIVRVTDRHIHLLKAWQTMLNHAVYIHVQTLPWYERPLHMVGDQDVLTALMGAAEFTDIPIVLLQRGVDIAQCFGPSGFTPAERLRGLFKGLPPLVHAMGRKPWTKPPRPPAIWNARQPFLKALREYYDYLALELSPYLPVALPYRQAVGDEAEWMDSQTTVGRLMIAMTGGSSTLQSFPLSVVDGMTRRIRRFLKIAKSSISPEFYLQESPLEQDAAK
ncbi:MAG: glycosyltransferase family 77 protein [Leptolyngbyaceae cyanobacterium SL_7_1]|nr:glycosyltransferase family 77 protein [Leptolyngbyaceae cyanobacterium SL_7_1]